MEKIGVHQIHHRVLTSPDDPVFFKLRDIELQRLGLAHGFKLFFSPERNFIFQQQLLVSFDDSVHVVLTTLELNGDILAYAYGFVLDGTYHVYNIAYLPQYAQPSPGLLTMQKAIEDAIRSGLRKFDFLRGSSYFKNKWCEKHYSQFHLTYLRDTLFNRFHGWLIFKGC